VEFLRQANLSWACRRRAGSPQTLGFPVDH